MENGTILALLLDFDGTLSPLVSQPHEAVLPPATKDILLRLSQLPNVFIGIVSGRGVADVMEKVGIQGLTYAGNHGLNIIHPDQSTVSYTLVIHLDYLLYINIYICSQTTLHVFYIQFVKYLYFVPVQSSFTGEP